MYLVLVTAAAIGLSAAPPAGPPEPLVPRITLTVIDPTTTHLPMPGPVSSLTLEAGRFELVRLVGYAGKVTWRVPASGPAAVYRLKPKGKVRAVPPVPSPPAEVADAGTVLVVGLKVGAAAGATYDVGDDPAVLVYPLPGRSGQAVVEALGVDADGFPVQLVEMLVTVGPRPPPGPTPNPPSPGGDSPFPGPGLHVLMVFDSSVTTRPAAQNSVLYGKAVTDYLKARCAKEPSPEGGTDGRAYRIYPANSDPSRAPKVWADALALALKSGKDWILIGDGKTGYSGPLPASEAEALALLKKYGGD